MIERNKEYEVDIIDNGYMGEGIAKIDNFAIFIPGAIKGEKVKVLINKVLTSHAFGEIVEIIEKSPYRVESDCSKYPRCGGCNLRHIDYEKTLEMKRDIVQNIINKVCKENAKDIVVEKTVGMGVPFNYRNKVQYPVGVNKENKAIYGTYASKTHTIVETDECLINKSIYEDIAKTIIEFVNKNKIAVYNSKIGKGILRHIIIKQGMQTGEIMVVLVLNNIGFEEEYDLRSILMEKYKNIKSIIKNINKKDTNVILGSRNINLLGDGYIEDILGDYTFKISASSFYQTNPVQTEYLYNKLIEITDLKKTDVVLDLYSGIGTIGIFVADKVKKVYGVELVKEAVNSARENAKLNKVDNIEFILGDVDNSLNQLVEEKAKPNVIIVDPPRKGLENIIVENILKLKPKKIVYISCNPSTLIRDIKGLEELYEVNNIYPIDMFPYTNHVETIVLMSRVDK